jgi:hypothetical protein
MNHYFYSYTERLLDNMILVTVPTRTIARIKPPLRALFPSELFLSPLPPEAVMSFVDNIILSDKYSMDHNDNNDEINNEDKGVRDLIIQVFSTKIQKKLMIIH